MRRASWAGLACVAAIAVAGRARAEGEGKDGFPSWEERVLLEWTNRARCDPQVEMTKCGAPCGDAACYRPVGPLHWDLWLNHAARFHSAEMTKQGFFAHDSRCSVATDIKTTFPTTCDGSASCACAAASPGTTFAARIGLFGAGPAGEIIASPSDPESAFYLWLFENSGPTCGFSLANGHRYNILTSGPEVGYGVSGNSTGDFGSGPQSEQGKIPSGSHYPRGGPDVEIWANFADAAPPKVTQVNLGGTCHAMALTRGSATNGAWLYKATGLSGCTRYWFNFKDSSGTTIAYPTTGSLGIGDVTCTAWDPTRPSGATGCDCTPNCAGKSCGDDGCGGSCGACGTNKACNNGQCVATCTPSCAGKSCGSDGCGGSCGACAAGQSCDGAGQCTTKCTASCAGKACGDDGCGGSCGACAAGSACLNGACVAGECGGCDAATAEDTGRSPPADDAGVAVDSSSAPNGATPDDAADATVHGSCACDVVGRGRGAAAFHGAMALAAMVAGIGARRGSRRRTKARRQWS